MKELWEIDFRHQFYSSETYKEARRNRDNPTDDGQREERIQSLERLLTTDNIDDALAADTKLDPKDMESIKSLGQNLCEDKSLPEHVARWQTLAVRARKLYTADPTRAVCSAWQELTAWYLKSKDFILQTEDEPSLFRPGHEMHGTAPAA